MRGLFITATDTDVGKTWITSLIARELVRSGTRVGVYKPACSGAERDGDGEFWPDLRSLGDATGNAFSIDEMCPQRFRAPLAPPVAAKREGRVVDAKLLRSGVEVFRDQDCVLVEGVGGLLCPMTDSHTIVDLAADLKFPLLVIARPNLGTINHTLLTLATARQRGLDVCGVVLNQASEAPVDSGFVASNAEQIERFGETQVLAFCGHQSRQLVDCRTGAVIKTDWLSLCGCGE